MTVQQKVLSTTPENRETPLSEVLSWVTPNRWFFVRSHYETPKIDINNWRLSIGGCVERPLELTWDQIEAMPRRSIFVTMECAGNGRSFLRKQVEGVQWTAGAVGHAEWSGISLRAILERARLEPDVTELVFYGADAGAEHGSDGPEPFARSLPLEKALHPDTLLATRMNGELLEPSHGYPLRLVVPGWYGVANVKWLTHIEAATQPFLGYFQTEKYTIKHRTGGGTRTDIVGPMPVKDFIDKFLPNPGDNDISDFTSRFASASESDVFNLRSIQREQDVYQPFVSHLALIILRFLTVLSAD